MHAARANLRKLSAGDGAVFARIWALSDELARGIADLFRRTGTAAIVQRVGPMFQILFTEEPAIWDYRQYCGHVDRRKYQRLSWALFEQGIYTSPAATLHSIVTAAHSREDVALTLAAMESALEKIA